MLVAYIMLRTSNNINLFIRYLLIALIPQHYCKLQLFKYLSNKKFLLWQVAEPSAQDFAMSKNSLILVLQI